VPQTGVSVTLGNLSRLTLQQEMIMAIQTGGSALGGSALACIAFACCDHAILLDKLYHNGIRGVSHKLFSNFLHNRMQCTKI